MTFLDEKTAPTIFEQAAEDIERLHSAGADVVFCLTHLGVNEESAPYRSYDLWETVKEKGAEKKPAYILDGHSHTVMTEVWTGEPILSTGTKFQNIGVIDSRYAQPAGRIHKWAPTSIEGAKVVLSATSFKYNGKVQKPSIKTINGLNLKVDTDYIVKWSAKSPSDHCGIMRYLKNEEKDPETGEINGADRNRF